MKGFDNKAQKRLELIRLAEKSGNVSEACRKFGVSRTYYYRWKRRYDQYGIEGLVDLSRAHKSHPLTTKESVVNEIKGLWDKNQNYHWVTQKVNDNGTNIALSTVREIVLYRL
ncbi:MAG: helix-turn-helix domain containing protein [Planctomycetes bacterium]|nr:helix-turn-helix domain containing protein [Planctomycetota bacterium]